MKKSPHDIGRTAIQAIAAITDPADRARVAADVAEEMERVRLEALGQARAHMSLREIGADILGGVSPQRADQVVKNFRRGTLDRAAYAFRDTADGTVHGPWDKLPEGAFETAALPFNPSSPSPFAGRHLEVRYGPWAPSEVNTYTLHLQVEGVPNGVVMRDTVELHAILYPGGA
jgi:hypothetical protein